MIRALRVDKNQQEIAEGLKKAGRSVVSLHQMGSGVPDLLVGYNLTNWLLEVKTEEGELTAAQERFFNSWKGQKAIVRNLKEALEITK